MPALSPRPLGSILLFLSLSLAARAEDNPHGDIFSNKPVPVVVDFNRDVRPIISSKCYHCHGPDEGSRKAKLRLDSHAEAVKEIKGVFAIKPGDLAASEVVARITSTDGDEVMPPPKEGHALTPREVEVMKKWIVQGAPYADHWAFVKPVKATPPSAAGQAVQQPIDAFIAASLAENGLSMAPSADLNTLVRRVSLDLTGLPPTPEEVVRFTAPSSSYEAMVDHYLAKPAFGERWARVWLDLARYADSAGYGSDPLRLNIWPYRDWVINAFNRNLPYDQFTTEQLAGDLLPNATQDQLVATAFHRNTMTNTEGGTDDEEFRVAAVKDRIATTAQVWMGLTLGCAQCHTHKFDPITQQEYYEFFAIFNQTEDSDKPDDFPTLAMPTKEEEAKKKELQAKVDQLEKLKAKRAEVAALEKDLKLSSIAEAEAKKAADALEQSLKDAHKALKDFKPLAVPVMKEYPKDKQRESHLFIKGNFLMPADKVSPSLLKSFNPAPAHEEITRLTVTKWIMSRDNPLTARVAVNRFWAQLFGTGLVETEEDFGTQGSLPSHPELLDWLAVDFMDQKWDIKALLKTMVMSATYRQSAKPSDEALKKDPRNRLLSHYARRRLDAEQVRDQALAISGLLSAKLGGPSVFPPQPDGLWRAAFNGQRSWETSKGEDRYRRGLYTFWRRTVPYPSMATFDAPSRENCTVRRLPTNTPLQAFVTMNDPAYVEMSQALGRRMMKEGGDTVESRVRYGLQLALARPAKEGQIAALVQLYQQELANYQAHPEESKKLATEPLGALPAGADPATMAAWTMVANVLLNMDAVLMKG